MQNNIESTFEQLLGRQITEKEKEHLYRVKNALKIQDNDALWLILMALESYNILYQQYPTHIRKEVESLVEKQKELMSEIAQSETKKAFHSLAEVVSNTSHSIANKMADAYRWISWGWAAVCLVIFGSLCLFVGFVLGSGNVPFWLTQIPDDDSFFKILLSALAKTPAGWIICIAGCITSLTALWFVRSLIFKVTGATILLVISLALLILSVIFILPLI